MATDNQPESGQTGEQELPTPEFSDTGASSTSSGAEEIVSKLLPQLEQIIERKVQSTKDKRISEIEKVLGGRSKILAELESEGVTIPKEVRTQMQIRELEERLAQPQSAQPAPVRDDGSSQQRAAVTDAIAELTKYGLDANDAGFIELLRGRYANRAEFDLKISRYVVGKLAPQKPASVADVVQGPASGNTPPSDVNRMIAELNEWQKTPSKYRNEIKQRVAELDKRGWK